MKPLGRDARSVIEAARKHEGIRDGDRDRLRARVMARAAAAGSVIAATTVASDVAAKGSAVAMSGAAQIAGVTKLGLPKLWVALAITAGGAASVYAVREVPSEPVAVLTPSIDRDVHDIAPVIADRARAAVVEAPLPSDVVSTTTAPPAEQAAPPKTEPSSVARAGDSGGAASADALGDEAKLLSRAQVAFGQGNGEAALDLLYQHGAQYPKGKLATERRALLAIVLCKSGRGDEGIRTAGSLLDRSTPLGTRIADACERK